jgi:hypothetical protein
MEMSREEEAEGGGQGADEKGKMRRGARKTKER